MNTSHSSEQMRRALSICIIVPIVLALFAGCSAGKQSRSSSQTSEKLASSLPAYIDSFLHMKDLSVYQRKVLNRAKKQGGVSRSDYEQAWSDYKTCMVEQGYAGIVILDYANGMKSEAAHQTGTDAQEHRYLKARWACENRYTSYINDIYGVQQGNPNLYADQKDGFVDCLKRNRLVPRSYSAKDYARQEHAAESSGNNHSYSFDSADPAVKACQVANNMLETDAGTDTLENLW